MNFRPLIPSLATVGLLVALVATTALAAGDVKRPPVDPSASDTDLPALDTADQDEVDLLADDEPPSGAQPPPGGGEDQQPSDGRSTDVVSPETGDGLGQAGEGDGAFDGVAPLHHSVLKIKRRVSPKYPDKARRLGLDTVACRVRIFIDEAGKPYDVRFVSCHQAFQDSARRALMQWRWFPAKVDGKKVKATFMIVIKYKLRDEPYSHKR